MTDDLDPDLPEAERAELLRVAARLEGERPAPPPGFRGALGRAVSAEARRRRLRPRPPHLWPLVLALGVVGTALLLVAAAQV